MAENSIFGHPAVETVMSIAAVDQATGDPWRTAEDFSSRGPSTVAFPARETRQTPFGAAADGVLITGAGGFGSGAPPRFFGTSAAAPHAAALAALTLTCDRSQSPDQVRRVLGFFAEDCGGDGYDNTYGYGLLKAGCAQPTATLISLVSFEVAPGSVRLTYRTDRTALGTPAVQRRDGFGGWLDLGRPAKEGGLLQFEDRSVAGGGRFAYRLRLRDGGSDHYSEETWVEVPGGPVIRVEGILGSSSRGSLALAVTLADDSPTRLEVFDPAGRHVVKTESGSGIASGIYIVRCSQGGRTVTAKAVVMR